MTREEINERIAELEESIQRLTEDAREYGRMARAEQRHIDRAKSVDASRSAAESRKRYSKSEYECKENRTKARKEISRLKQQLRSLDNPRYEGVVKWYSPDKGFGYIKTTSHGDVKVTRASLRESSALDKGDPVSFYCVKSPTGKFKAVDVRYVKA